MLDAEGRVVRASSLGEELVRGVTGHAGGDVAFADLFSGEGAERVRQLAANGWVGVTERRLSLADGRRVVLNAALVPDATAERYHISVRDITTAEMLDGVQDHRRRTLMLSEFAGSLARELNDPISIVQGRIELVLELGDEVPPMLHRHLTVALEHARRISATLRNLRLVGRATLPRLETVVLAEVLRDARDLVAARLKTRSFEVEVAPSVEVGGEQAMYARLFANVIGHLLDVAPRDAPITLRAMRDGETVVVTAEGGAAGTAFRRLAEVDVATGAGGLGLGMADSIVQSVGGAIRLRQGRNAAHVEVTLPPSPGRRARRRPHQERMVVVGGEQLEGVLAAMLDREGFYVRRVDSGEEALKELEGDPAVGSLAVELFLPGMSGLAFAEEVERRHPRLQGRLLLVTDAELTQLPASVRVLRPPLHRAEVLQALGRRVRRSR